MLTPSQIQIQLQNMISPQQILTHPEDMAPWLTDWRGLYHGQAAAVVFPCSTEEVSKLVAFCAQHQLPITPQGGNTGLCGGATPDSHATNIVINLSQMKQVRELNTEANTITVEAGCILGDIQRLANEHQRLLAIDLAAKDSCQIGGNLSTNAGGLNVLRYGMARDQVLGLEVVLPSGEIMHGLRTLRKDNTGYDLKQLFIGAEGTLGIITAASLKLHPKPTEHLVAMVAIRSPQAGIQLLTLLQQQLADSLQAFEYFSADCLDLVVRHYTQLRSPFSSAYPHYILLELATTGSKEILHTQAEQVLSQALELEICQDVVLANTLNQAQSLWALRENISEALHQIGAHLKHDITLPIEQLPTFMAQTEQQLKQHYPSVRPFIFGHLGDGNLHYNIACLLGTNHIEHLQQENTISQLIFDQVSAFNGSFSAEHGIGQLKRGLLADKKSPLELTLMRDIKRLLDPQGIMNPGKVF